MLEEQTRAAVITAFASEYGSSGREPTVQIAKLQCDKSPSIDLLQN